MPSAADHLESIFASDRALRGAEKLLLAEPEAEVADLLVAQVAEAQKLDAGEERTMRVERLADLCAQVAGPKTIAALIDILDEEDSSTRARAGDALLEVAYDRYAEVARAIETTVASKRTGHAMSELPWVLQEVGEPSALKLIGGFLRLESPDVVASAIEAIAELGDPGGIDLLEPLAEDRREAVIEEGDEQLRGTIGELASEAIAKLTVLRDFEEELEEMMDDKPEPPKRGPQPQQKSRGPRR